nr:MAG TPA: hypothetical protein [Caudoviricetes sp.]
MAYLLFTPNKNVLWLSKHSSPQMSRVFLSGVSFTPRYA